MGPAKPSHILWSIVGSLLCSPFFAWAQPEEKTLRVGWVGFSPAGEARTHLIEGFRAGLRERGWIEGKNLSIDARAADSVDAAAISKELVNNKTDVIVASGPMVGGVKSQAGATPIVFVMTGDPAEVAWVASLARPGGNLTGLSALALELEAKRLSLLKELNPAITRVAVLANARHPGYRSQLKAAHDAAQRLGLTLQVAPVASPKDFEAAFAAIAKEGAEAIVSFPDGLIDRQGKVIAEFARQRQIPTIGGFASFVESGNLMSYGPIERELFARAAYYVDRIAKGAKAADLPVELPTRFELAVNSSTAKAIGLAVPQSILLRADRVIH
jgi:putative ABC transport system substrate-binding protein